MCMFLCYVNVINYKRAWTYCYSIIVVITYTSTFCIFDRSRRKELE